MRYLSSLFVAVLTLAFAGGALAQGGPGGPGAPSPEMRKRMEEFQKFRENHKYTFQLRGTVAALAEMEKGTRCPLTPDQARKVMAVINPLKKKERLTQDEAKQALKALKAPLTTRQLTEIGRIAKELEERQQRQRAQGGPGSGAPGGRRPGGPGGGGPAFDPAKAKDFNPFLPPKADSPMQRGYARLQEGIALLEKKANQK